MNTLLESIDYTKGKKKYQLNNLIESHYIRPNEIFNEFLNNTLKTKSTVALNLEYSSSWYLWEYFEKYFVSGIANLNLLAISTKHAYLSNFLRYLIGISAPKYNSHVLLRIATMNLGQMLFLGWNNKAIKYGNILLKMLDDKFYKGGTQKPLNSWFIIQLFCKWQNINFNKSKYNIPENLGIYDTALKNLSSNDTELIDNIIKEMANYHILNSDEYVKTNENGDEISAEFASSNYFIFPIEILMFLLVRRALGLPEYDVKKNELLSLEINHIPNSVIEYPQNDIVDKIFDKLYKENPEYNNV